MPGKLYVRFVFVTDDSFLAQKYSFILSNPREYWNVIMQRGPPVDFLSIHQQYFSLKTEQNSTGVPRKSQLKNDQDRPQAKNEAGGC